MQPSKLTNIMRLLALCPLHITVRQRPYPRHWKSKQLRTLRTSIGEQIRKHRLELHWRQADVARKLGVTTVSISDWERGVTTPSRRMAKKIENFLNHGTD